MIYWIWLTQIPFIGPIAARKLIEYFENAENVYKAKEKYLEKIPGLSIKQKKNVIEFRSLKEEERILENCEKQSIDILCWQDERYPTRAKEPKDAPVILYYKGHFKEIERTIGIVGARRCSQQDKRRAVNIASECVEKGITVISGMAKGIDSYAHTACLNAGGYTIAIMGNGLDICYPSEHYQLMKEIEDKGLLLSEYPPGTLPTKYTFPRRNRLISSWSDKLFVIGAGKGSGALITADYSKKYARKVYW